MGRLFDEWKQKNAETGEKSVNDKACGELVHKRALLIFNPVAGEGRSLRLLPQVVKHMTDNGYACTTLTTINSGSATEYVKKYGAENEIVVCSGGDGTSERGHQRHYAASKGETPAHGLCAFRQHERLCEHALHSKEQR